jgi:pimeloyl-ACP methyl ester carboxylesterase
MTARELSVLTDDGVVIAGEESSVDAAGLGDLDTGHPRDSQPARTEPTRAGGQGRADGRAGVPIILLHGLTATRRYVVMGSRLLERSGHRVIAYDARGHGRSTAAVVAGGRTAGEAEYGYARLARDLEAVLDALGLPRAALAGASMGAHTILRFALDHPERVAALGLVTPAFDPAAHLGADGGTDPTASLGATGGIDDLAPTLAGAVHPEGDRDVLARALREGGVEAFVRAYDFSTVPPAWRETVETVVRQRLSAHEHPTAVADAMEVVSRSRPFEDFAELAAIAVPTVVVASRDEVDPGHPLALAERYAQAIPGATFTVEDGGVGGHQIRSPIAWQGGQLSKVLVELLARGGARPHA